MPGHFRGSTKEALRRELRRTFDELSYKGVDVIVVLTDSDGADWREVQRRERAKLPAERAAVVALAVCDRNVESWICTDPGYIAAKTGVAVEEFEVEDPKGRFESAMGITSSDRKEREISELVRSAPLRTWLRSRSFEDFYEQLRDISQRQGCVIENLRERARS